MVDGVENMFAPHVALRLDCFFAAPSEAPLPDAASQLLLRLVRDSRVRLQNDPNRVRDVLVQWLRSEALAGCRQAVLAVADLVASAF